MITKLKIGLLIVVLASFVGIGSAYAGDLVFSVDTTVTIGSASYTITSGSTATSIETGASSITVVVPENTYFTFKSTDKYVLTSTYGSADCSASANTLSMSRAGSFTITPDATTVCSVSGGGGGGGGGSVSTTPAVTTPAVPAVPAVPATPAVPGNVIEGCGNRTTGFSTATGTSCVGNTSTTPAVPATPATPATPASSPSFATTGVYNFGTTTLKNGSKGEPVKELQRFLNQVLDLGLKIDGKLGPKTIAVIKKWQKANGLVVDGLIGPKTKAKMNAMK